MESFLHPGTRWTGEAPTVASRTGRTSSKKMREMGNIPSRPDVIFPTFRTSPVYLRFGRLAESDL
jgi:hypothetical protein